MYKPKKLGFLLCIRNQQGQALLITVLVMVVALTVGLGVASRSIIQVKTANDEANSQKAFSAAEAGIDQVLKTGTGVTSQSLGNNASIASVSIAPVQNKKILVDNGTQILQDQGADVWLANHTDFTQSYSGPLTVYWGTASPASPCNTEGAVEISIISHITPPPPPTQSPYTIARYAFDPCVTRVNGNGGNHFTYVTTGSYGIFPGQTFNYSATINTINAGILARIIPLYADSAIGVEASNTLPSQGQLVTSTGVSGDTQRKITYFQGYDSVPSELFYSLFSTQ